MQTEPIQIVDRGRGPQLSTTRITVLDVFYYLHRGDNIEQIRQAMPSLSRAELDVVLAYIGEHQDELLEADRRAEEFVQRGIAEQKATGIYREVDESIPLHDRITRLRETMRRQRAERNGDHAAG